MPTQAPEIDGVTLINDFEGAEPRPGEIRRLRITEAHDYDVVGTLLPATRDCRRSSLPAPLISISSLYEVSDLQERSRTRRSGFSVLQRALPADRSGNWASGKIRDLRAPVEPNDAREDEPDEE